MLGTCYFCFVCHRPVSCLANIAIVSGLSILDCPFGFLLRLLLMENLKSNFVRKYYHLKLDIFQQDVQ